MSLFPLDGMLCNVQRLTCSSGEISDDEEEEEKQENFELDVIRNKLQSMLLESYNLNLWQDVKDDETYVEYEELTIHHYRLRFRRVFVKNSPYFVGWVAYSDTNMCMSCGDEFQWISSRNHCRACGNIVCSKCSPYTADIAPLKEANGSIVCKPCFHDMLQHYDDETRRPQNFKYLEFGAIYAGVASPKISSKQEHLLQGELSQTCEEYTFGTTDKESMSAFGNDAAEMKRIKSRVQNKNLELNPLRGHISVKTTFRRESSDTSLESDAETTKIEDEDEILSPMTSTKAQLSTRNINHQNKNLTFSPFIMNSRSLSSKSPNPKKDRLKLMSPRLCKNSFNQSFSGRSVCTIYDEELVRLLESGEAGKARSLIRLGCELPSNEEVTRLLHHIVENVDKVLEPLGTIEILLESCKGNVNAEDVAGNSILMKIVRTKSFHIGDYLMSQGANCLQDNKDCDCPLSISFDLGISWLFDIFVENHEEKLLKSQDFIHIERYIMCLIFAGKISHLTKLFDNGLVSIGLDEAQELFYFCDKNHSKMRDPQGAFDLLRNLAGDDCILYSEFEQLGFDNGTGSSDFFDDREYHESDHQEHVEDVKIDEIYDDTENKNPFIKELSKSLFITTEKQ